MSKGTLVIAGGALGEQTERIHRRFLDEAGPGAKLAIIPSAGGEGAEENSAFTVKLWESLGVSPGNIVCLPVPGRPGDRDDSELVCDSPEFAALLDGASGAWFTGGDQFYIWKEFVKPNCHDTLALRRLREILNKGGVMGGVSAGAAIMSSIMIGDGTSATALHYPAIFGYDGYWDKRHDSFPRLRITQGLGFFPLGVIDQHFDARPRLFRLVESVFLSGDRRGWGFGVAEETALIYSFPNKTISVIGAGGVYAVDARKAFRMDIGKQICHDDLVLHLLNEGDSYNTETEEFLFKNSGQACEEFELNRDTLAGELPHTRGFGSFIMDHVVLNKDEALKLENGMRYAQGFMACEANGQLWGHELKYFKTPLSKAYRESGTKVSFCHVGLATAPYSITPAL
ncbi:MAG: cyanophycinase [Clostridiales bacterium]|jgi:cyanophycinase|nr:cyanophycinase [Clostridiales bacterium]